jgi:hypothetical protein
LAGEYELPTLKLEIGMEWSEKVDRSMLDEKSGGDYLKKE